MILVRPHHVLTVRPRLTKIYFRTIATNCFMLQKDSNVDPNPETKSPKMSIIRKTIRDNKEGPIVLESKKASDVIKKLNWENQQLFGDIISTTQMIKMPKHVGDNNIIHNEPRITVSGIEGKSELLVSNSGNFSSEDELSKKFQDVEPSQNIFSTILNFPFTNQKTTVKEKPDDIIFEANNLRQLLMSLNVKKIPSVTSVLEKTMSPERRAILERWKSGMIKEMGEEKFKQYQIDLLANGSSFHNSINLFLSGTPEIDLEVLPPNIGHWKSLKAVLPNVSHVKLLEEIVSHPFLCYRGVVDCFAKYCGHLVVIDWKTSKKPKETISSTYDSPLQIAAYVGALNFDPKFQYIVKKGVIVIAYENGNRACPHYMNEHALLNYWKQWLKRLKSYWESVEH